MLPSKSLKVILDHINKQYEAATPIVKYPPSTPGREYLMVPTSDPHKRIGADGRYLVNDRIIGIVVANEGNPTTRSKLSPLMQQYHYRSGEHIDFFFIGYEGKDGGNTEDWSFDDLTFSKAIDELEDRSTWQFSGDVELLLFQTQMDDGIIKINYRRFISSNLDAMLNDDVIISVASLFETIFKICKEDTKLSLNKLSNKLGVSMLSDSTIDLLVSKIPGGFEKIWTRGKHYAVRG